MATDYYFVGQQGAASAFLGGAITSPITAANGTVGAPSYAFTSSPSSGMYSPSANQLAFAQNGVQALLFSGSQQATFGGNAVFPSGTAATPAVQVGATSGLYLAAANTMGVSVGGAALLTLQAQAGTTRFDCKAGAGSSAGYQFYAGNGALATSFDASNGFLQRAGGIAASPAGLNVASGTIGFDGLASANGAFCQMQAVTTTSGALSGASVTLTNLIPAGSLVFGVVSRVTTAITGATSFSVGDTAAGTQYGNSIAVAQGTTTTIANTTLTSPKFYPSATSVILTANGSNFTGGAVRVTVYYLALSAPTS